MVIMKLNYKTCEEKFEKTNYKLDDEEVVENEDEVPVNCAQQ